MLSVAALTGLLPFGVFAAGPAANTVDTANVTLTWEATIPTVVNGKWITITGEGGESIASVGLNLKANGSFESDPVKVEVRYWDEATSKATTPVMVGTETASGSGVAPQSINYRVSAPAFVSQKGVDLSRVDVFILKNDRVIRPNMVKKETDPATAWQSTWKIRNGFGGAMTNVIAGDVITATSILRIDVPFVTK
ncbi:hypothetical protein [Vibrio sp. SCSIO 43137]|uniref:hypothetical protein n=1 Tax=Vibrio sp. SCSIO 43137 TaxID=3021011 RepID=UPI00230773C1|nr:hypothetical protein [Vibrio sp. SCSIO 43137]WCE32215.1 hypothetical protein PK654_17100 [Vibrio sp. SCSIO 43137]